MLDLLLLYELILNLIDKTFARLLVFSLHSGIGNEVIFKFHTFFFKGNKVQEILVIFIFLMLCVELDVLELFQ